jgi:hypothetical protein
VRKFKSALSAIGNGVNPIYVANRAEKREEQMIGPSRYDYAELIAALWKLGADQERMPTSHGILDRALHEVREKLPEPYRQGLTFGMTSVGLRCFELPDILLAAQDALITSEPNPTYLATEIALSEGSARKIVVRNGLSTAQAREIGQQIKAQVDDLRQRWSIEGGQPVAA